MEVHRIKEHKLLSLVGDSDSAESDEEVVVVGIGTDALPIHSSRVGQQAYLDSGTDDSGTDDSGTDDSGTDDSGTDDSGTDDSGTDSDEYEEDTAPRTPPQIASAGPSTLRPIAATGRAIVFSPTHLAAVQTINATPLQSRCVANEALGTLVSSVATSMQGAVRGRCVGIDVLTEAVIAAVGYLARYDGTRSAKKTLVMRATAELVQRLASSDPDGHKFVEGAASDGTLDDVVELVQGIVNPGVATRSWRCAAFIRRLCQCTRLKKPASGVAITKIDRIATSNPLTTTVGI